MYRLDNTGAEGMVGAGLAGLERVAIRRCLENTDLLYRDFKEVIRAAMDWIRVRP